MIKFILRRLVMLIPVLIGVTLITFLLMSFVPGDPVRMMMGQHIDPAVEANIRADLGLDKPLIIQYKNFIVKAAHGDFGTSYIRRRPVLELIKEKLPVTFRLTLVGMVIAVFFGVLAGIISAVKQYSWIDKSTTLAALAGVSLPAFWVGIMLQLIFGLKLKILPISGYGDGDLKHLILPGIVLGITSMALYARMTRSSMLEVIRQDYIRTARAKGLSEWVVIFKHALKNALIPIVTLIGMDFASFMGGAILTETVFSLPGFGRMMFEAISRRDFPLIQGGVFFASLIFILTSLLVDILYAYIDPRIKYD